MEPQITKETRNLNLGVKKKIRKSRREIYCINIAWYLLEMAFSDFLEFHFGKLPLGVKK